MSAPTIPNSMCCFRGILNESTESPKMLCRSLTDAELSQIRNSLSRTNMYKIILKATKIMFRIRMFSSEKTNIDKYYELETEPLLVGAKNGV